MKFQIALLLVLLAPQCRAANPSTGIDDDACPTATVCPLGHDAFDPSKQGVMELKPGCCAKDPDSSVAKGCTSITDQKVCSEQIIGCDWSAGPPSGQVYTASDHIQTGDDADPVITICYESQDFTALRAYLATIKDDAQGAHQIGYPHFGACADCYMTTIYPAHRATWSKVGTVAPGVIQYASPKMTSEASTTQALEVAGPVGGNSQCIPEGYDCDNTYQCCKDLTCTDTTDPPFQKSVCSDNREPTIARVASAFPGLSQFVKALKTAKLLTILDNDAPCPSCPAHHSGPFTVFAPNDEAFAALPKATLAHLLDPKNIKELQAVLKYHIATGPAGAICFPMDDAACYRMSGPGEPPSPAPVIYGAAIAANLKSPCWHINGNPHLDPCWINQTVKTLQGQDVSVRYKCKEVYGESICDGGQFADNSKVTSDNFSGRNGVMHIIDRVLIPPTTLLTMGTHGNDGNASALLV